jgi:hypothetical protein
MNQEFKNIDDLFQSAFADDSAEVPAFVKANIDKKLNTQKSKKGWIWLSSFALVLLISATLIWTLNADETNLAETTSDSTNLTSQNLNSNNNTSANHSSETTNEANGYATSNSENQTESQLTQTNSDLTKKSDSDNSGINPSAQSTTKSNAGDSKSEPDFTTTTSSDQNQKKGNTSNGTSLDPNQQNISLNSSGSARENTSNFRLPLSVRMFEKQVSGKILNPISKSLTQSNPTSAHALFGKNEIEATLIEAREIYNPWMISVTGGMNFSKSKYTSPIASEVTLYSDSNNDKPGFEGNIDVRYRLKNSLTFGTGLAISQLKENYDLFKQSISLDSTLVWSYQDIYEYDTLLDSNIWVGIDSTSTTNYDTTSVTLYDASGTNTATYLHIPFSIGTQIIRNKFRFDLYVMGRFNYLLNASGGYVENESFNTFSKTNQIYKPWYFDVMLGTAVHYQLFEKLYLTGTFRYRPQIGNLYQGLSFNKAVQSYHIGLGVSWKL